LKFLVDQDVYFLTVQLLKGWGHDVVTATELSMQRAPDVEMLRKAAESDRLLVTRDKGFGSLVFLGTPSPPGVILLRLSPTTIDDVHKELHRLLLEHSEEELRSLFCIIEPHRHRLRHLK
jgi:predicted nuclease of predicted toxin-antitoxin system